MEKESETLVIHGDRLRFRGNMVSIVTAPLRMPLVANRKRNATHCRCSAQTHGCSRATSVHLNILQLCEHTHTHQICPHGKDPMAPRGKKKSGGTCWAAVPPVGNNELRGC